ncbi:hypothetical protein [Streptomyces niger]|uniref:hypothetical protein n=1 Tax=Streptomyces niger TaxID=66373 RepID=UPI00069B7E6C|nr:hypothetical protein [Streptomyces niger]
MRPERDPRGRHSATEPARLRPVGCLLRIPVRLTVGRLPLLRHAVRLPALRRHPVRRGWHPVLRLPGLPLLRISVRGPALLRVTVLRCLRTGLLLGVGVRVRRGGLRLPRGGRWRGLSGLGRRWRGDDLSRVV